MCHPRSGLWLGVAALVCAGLGTSAAGAEQRTNIANTGGELPPREPEGHRQYEFPGERTIMHGTSDRKLDYRFINVVEPRGARAAEPEPAEAEAEVSEPVAAPAEPVEPAAPAPPTATRRSNWWGPFWVPWGRQVPAAAPAEAAPAAEPAARAPTTATRRSNWWGPFWIPWGREVPAAAPAPTPPLAPVAEAAPAAAPYRGRRLSRPPPTGEHVQYEFPGERTISHTTSERRLDYRYGGEAQLPPKPEDLPAAPVGSLRDTGRGTTYGQYEGRRTTYWRELALSGDPEAYERLIAALQYYPIHDMPNDIRTRRDAAEALGALGDPRAIQALEDALNDPDFLVRQRAAQSLAILHEKIR